MTNKEKIKRLTEHQRQNQYCKKLFRQLEELSDRITELRSGMVLPPIRLDGMPRSGSTDDGMARYAAELDNLQAKRQRLKRRYMTEGRKWLKMREQAETIIIRAKFPERIENIVRCRFLEGYSFRFIAKRLHEKESTVRYKIKNAVASIPAELFED